MRRVLGGRWTLRTRHSRVSSSRAKGGSKKKKKEGGQKGGDGRAQLFDFESGLCIIQRELKLFPVRAWISGGRFCIGPSACGGK